MGLRMLVDCLSYSVSHPGLPHNAPLHLQKYCFFSGKQPKYKQACSPDSLLSARSEPLRVCRSQSLERGFHVRSGVCSLHATFLVELHFCNCRDPHSEIAPTFRRRSWGLWLGKRYGTPPCVSTDSTDTDFPVFRLRHQQRRYLKSVRGNIYPVSKSSRSSSAIS